MRALNGTLPSWLAALEEALVAFGIVLVVNLLAFGFPPAGEAFYISGLTGVAWGLKTWAEARALKLHLPPPGGPGGP